MCSLLRLGNRCSARSLPCSLPRNLLGLRRPHSVPATAPSGSRGGAESPGGEAGAQPSTAAAADAAEARFTMASLPPDPVFEIVSEEVVHKRYVTMYNRAVRFPPTAGQAEGPTYEYDVAGHPQADFHFSNTFPFHPGGPGGGSVTLLREYAQGLNKMMWCLPTGGFDPRKHASYEACAKAELSEEAHLTGGIWYPLLPEEHPGFAEIKWGRNRFHAFLCVDPAVDEQPGARDREEFIRVVRVSVPELRTLMLGGDMLLPSITACFLALERLGELGLLGDKQAAAGQQTAARQQQQAGPS